MASFDDVRLPDDIEQGAVGGPNFQTTVIAMSSGREQRNQDWAEARGEWNIAYGISDKADYQVTQAFFFARRGRSRGFRFKDWADYEFDEIIGVGSTTTTTTTVLGVTTTTTTHANDFPLVKTYELGGPHPYVRAITRPVASSLKVYLGAVLQTSGWSLTSGHIIHFDTPPADGVLVRVKGEFDVPVRFDTDKFELTLDWVEAGAVQGLAIVELRE